MAERLVERLLSEHDQLIFHSGLPTWKKKTKKKKKKTTNKSYLVGILNVPVLLQPHLPPSGPDDIFVPNISTPLQDRHLKTIENRDKRTEGRIISRLSSASDWRNYWGNYFEWDRII